MFKDVLFQGVTYQSILVLDHIMTLFRCAFLFSIAENIDSSPLDVQIENKKVAKMATWKQIQSNTLTLNC